VCTSNPIAFSSSRFELGTGEVGVDEPVFEGDGRVV
jgi:hypothetical protein